MRFTPKKKRRPGSGQTATDLAILTAAIACGVAGDVMARFKRPPKSAWNWLWHTPQLISAALTSRSDELLCHLRDSTS